MSPGDGGTACFSVRENAYTRFVLDIIGNEDRRRQLPLAVWQDLQIIFITVRNIYTNEQVPATNAIGQ